MKVFSKKAFNSKEINVEAQTACSVDVLMANRETKIYGAYIGLDVQLGNASQMFKDSGMATQPVR